MSDNAEAGIAQTKTIAAQTQGADGLDQIHRTNIAYLNERIIVFLLVLTFLSLVLFWLTTNSALLTYGSFAVFVVIAISWGVIRIRKIQATRDQRDAIAKSYRSKNRESTD